MQANGVRKRALLRGTGWTLAVAAVAALALFKYSPNEPIYLLSLGLVALGWAWVLQRALAAEQHAAAAAMNAAGGDTRAVLDALAQAVGVEMQRAYNELVRVDDLLAHAIEQLMAAFNSVSEEVRRHQDELVYAAAGAQGTPAAEQMRAAGARVASEVSGAVTALQFRDVVGQKLGHVRCELEALELVMHRVREVSAGTPGQAELARQVRCLLQELELARAASPVKQELMHAGEIDLF